MKLLAPLHGFAVPSIQSVSQITLEEPMMD
jgi:hypothetical protein